MVILVVSMRYHPQNPRPPKWSWREAARDVMFAVAFWLLAYVMFKYGGMMYVSEGNFPPPPPEIESGR